MNIFNLLNEVIPRISPLTPPRPIEIFVYEYDKKVDGVYNKRCISKIQINGIVQQQSPNAATRLNDSTLDSKIDYKVYLITTNSLILNSTQKNLHDYHLCFEDPIGSGNRYIHNIYSVKNYTMNGWVVCGVGRINEGIIHGDFKT